MLQAIAVNPITLSISTIRPKLCHFADEPKKGETNRSYFRY